MDAKRLHSFVAVAETGSFTAAGRTLGIPQPAVSQHVVTLETSLQTRLFERGRNGAQLTEQGDRFLPHARLILANMQRAREEVSDPNGVPEGNISLGLPQSVSIAIAAQLAVETRKEYPRIKLRIVEALSGHLQQWVELGQVDLAILFGGIGLPAVAGRVLKSEELLLVGAPSQMKGLRNPISPRKLQKLPLILPGTPHGLRSVVDHAFLELGLEPRIELEIDSAEAILSLVQSGEGYTIFPDAGVTRETAQGRLVSSPIADPNFSRSLVLVRSRSRVMNAGTNAVSELLRKLVTSRQLG